MKRNIGDGSSNSNSNNNIFFKKIKCGVVVKKNDKDIKREVVTVIAGIMKEW